MSEPWFILTKRFGADVRNPSFVDLQSAVQEVVDFENMEHTNTFIRFGVDAGPMYVLTYNTSRRLSFEQWADQDFESELQPPTHLVNVSPVEAASVMQELGAGHIDLVKRRAWVGGR
jgi:hypothetical protein